MFICCLFYLYAAAGCSTREVPLVPAPAGHFTDPELPFQHWKLLRLTTHAVSETPLAAAEFFWTEALQNPESLSFLSGCIISYEDFRNVAFPMFD